MTTKLQRAKLLAIRAQQSRLDQAREFKRLRAELERAQNELHLFRLQSAFRASPRVRAAAALVLEAYDYGQFSEDFDRPPAHVVRAAICTLCEVMK